MPNEEIRRPATDEEIRDLVMRRMLPATHGNDDERAAAAKAAAKLEKANAAATAEKAAVDEKFHELTTMSTAMNLGREKVEEMVAESLQRAAEPEPTDEEKAALALLSNAGLGE